MLNMMTDSERQPMTSYQCLIDMLALSRTVYELLTVFTDTVVNRKCRDIDISARGRHRSIMPADFKRQSTTFYLCLIDTFALLRTVYELYAVFTDLVVSR